MVTLYRAPASYSGEDAAEISHHASPWISHKIMEMLLARGATAAMPGEFTMRAFMNGRIDLSQAEAVADMIAADSAAAHRLAASQLRGGLFVTLGVVRQAREDAWSNPRVHVCLKFPHQLPPVLMSATRSNTSARKLM